MPYRGHCAHCNADGRTFPRSRPNGHGIPLNTAHRFIISDNHQKVCTKCDHIIHRSLDTQCDYCRDHSPSDTLSHALLMAADAARQQIQVVSTTDRPLIPPSPPLAMPVTSSEILPAQVISTVIRPLEMVASCILSGIIYTQYQHLKQFIGVPMSRDTWFTHQRDVFDAIRDVEEHSELVVVADIKTRENWVGVADGGWSQRRNANFHSFIIMDVHSSAVVHAEIINKKLVRELDRDGENHRIITIQESNYDGSSHGMEGEAFTRSLQWLQNNNILKKMEHFVSDESKTIESILKNNPLTQHVRIWNDPGHVALNFKKSLDKALGQAIAVKGMSSRMEGWFLTSVKLAEQECTERRPEDILQSFTRRMSHFMWHYTGMCMTGCPCREQADIEQEAQRTQPTASLSTAQTLSQTALEWSQKEAESEQKRRKERPVTVRQRNTVLSMSIARLNLLHNPLRRSLL